MKMRFSPLVTGLSGKAGDAVAATWKGIAYVRKLVIPHNPQSAAQTLVRESLARCVEMWRSLHAVIKAWLDTYGTGYQMSGYNVFMSKCRVLEQADDVLIPVPPNPHCDAITDAAFATGAGAAGDIDFTWTDDGPVAFTHVIVIARETLTNRFQGFATAAVATETVTIEGLTPDTAHDCYAFLHNETTDEMGTSHGQQAVSSKAA